MPTKEAYAVHSTRLEKPPFHQMSQERVEQIKKGLLDICLNIDMHPNEPFSRRLEGTPRVTVYPANELAIALGRKRYVDLNISHAFPGSRNFYEYEYRRAREMTEYYRENNFDLVLDFHNCGTYRTGKAAHMKPRTDDKGMIYEDLVVAAGMMGLFNIVLLPHEYSFLNHVDNAISIEVPRHTGNPAEQERAYQQDLQKWRSNIGLLTQTRPGQLSFKHVDFEPSDFTFFNRDREISRREAKELGLEEFYIGNAFDPLPQEVARRLGYKVPIFAEYWNYNCDAELIPRANGERAYFGSILTHSNVQHLLNDGREDLVLPEYDRWLTAQY